MTLFKPNTSLTLILSLVTKAFPGFYFNHISWTIKVGKDLINRRLDANIKFQESKLTYFIIDSGSN